MKKSRIALFTLMAAALIISLLFAGCAEENAGADSGHAQGGAPPAEEQPSGGDTPQEGSMINLIINGTEIGVTWEDNASVEALASLLADEGAITIRTSRYGGFEQVGSLPQSLPSDDTRMQAAAGDIMLCTSRSVVLFYGSNTWAYTKLGRISGLTASEIRELLDVPSTEIVLSPA